MEQFIWDLASMMRKKMTILLSTEIWPIVIFFPLNPKKRIVIFLLLNM
jgi:hypothetical protein